MANAETNILKRIMLTLKQSRLFRNNVGVAYQGEVVRLASGDIILKKARQRRFGLINGSSDLIGWTTVEITPDMVGQKVAVFTAIEVKTKTGRVSKAQKTFIENVIQAGGYAGVARSPEDAIAISNPSRQV